MCVLLWLRTYACTGAAREQRMYNCGRGWCWIQKVADGERRSLHYNTILISVLVAYYKFFFLLFCLRSYEVLNSVYCYEFLSNFKVINIMRQRFGSAKVTRSSLGSFWLEGQYLSVYIDLFK